MFSFYYVVAIHPDRSLVFFFQRWNRKLIAYNMDSKEVCALHKLGDGYPSINPYTPCLVVSSTLVNKHGLLYSSRKEGCYRWLENGISEISSRVKMAIRNCFTPWKD